jgi:hypothetical protein
MTLEIAEALHYVGCLPREELPTLATELLVAGADSPALRRLAGITGPELDEAAECFTRVLHELGRAGIKKHEAVRRLALDLARAVTSGTLPRKAAAERGAQLARTLDYEKMFWPLYLAEDHYDCPCHGPTIADTEVVCWAREILDAGTEPAV